MEVKTNRVHLRQELDLVCSLSPVAVLSSRWCSTVSRFKVVQTPDRMCGTAQGILLVLVRDTDGVC